MHCLEGYLEGRPRSGVLCTALRLFRVETKERCVMHCLEGYFEGRPRRGVLCTALRAISRGDQGEVCYALP